MKIVCNVTVKINWMWTIIEKVIYLLCEIPILTMEYRICQIKKIFGRFNHYSLCQHCMNYFSSTNMIHSDNRLAKKVTIRSRYCIASLSRDSHLKYGSFRPWTLFVKLFLFLLGCINSRHHVIFVTLCMITFCCCYNLRKTHTFCSDFHIWTWESFIYLYSFPIRIYLIFLTS